MLSRAWLPRPRHTSRRSWNREFVSLEGSAGRKIRPPFVLSALSAKNSRSDPATTRCSEPCAARRDIGGESQKIGARSQDVPTAARYNLLRFNTIRSRLENADPASITF
jgi:hypothetical protein